MATLVASNLDTSNEEIPDLLLDSSLDSSFAKQEFGSSLTGTLPRFDRFPDVSYAQAARIAGRVNAAAISEAEHNALLVERQSLLDKEFAKTITPKESRRLEYVRWSLDRIEDAKYGYALDFLEGSVSRYEQFLGDLNDLQHQLRRYQAPSKKKK